MACEAQLALLANRVGKISRGRVRVNFPGGEILVGNCSGEM